MPFFMADLPSITVSSGGSNSNAISLVEDAYGLGIAAPATLTASQVTVQVAMSSGAAATFVTLQSGGSDVVLAAGKALIITPLPYRQLRVNSSVAGGEGAARTFTVSKVLIV